MEGPTRHFSEHRSCGGNVYVWVDVIFVHAYGVLQSACKVGVSVGSWLLVWQVDRDREHCFYGKGVSSEICIFRVHRDDFDCCYVVFCVGRSVI